MKVTATFSLLVLLAGCQAFPPPLPAPVYGDHRYLERDLTAPWSERQYWRPPSATSTVTHAWPTPSCFGKDC